LVGEKGERRPEARWRESGGISINGRKGMEKKKLQSPGKESTASIPKGSRWCNHRMGWAGEKFNAWGKKQQMAPKIGRARWNIS